MRPTTVCHTLLLSSLMVLAVSSVGAAAAAEAGNPGSPPLRSMRYTARSKEAAVTWQQELRGKLLKLLRLDDLASARPTLPLDAKTIATRRQDGYESREMEIRSTPGRTVKIVVTVPAKGDGPWPAVVCIHGHGGKRQTVYEEPTIYREFARALAGRGYVTIATDVGQHKVYEEGRTLMGERLWDLMRCVDFLESLPQVDKSCIGCAGLSLGGEMAMWLAAMDERVAATVSAGFLTRMDQMEKNHCMCWKFEGLRELADFADLYALTAPRALLCQNGLQEPATQFPPAMACQAAAEIGPIYQDLGAPDRFAVLVHPEGHVIHLPGLLAFFDEHLGGRVSGR